MSRSRLRLAGKERSVGGESERGRSSWTPYFQHEETKHRQSFNDAKQQNRNGAPFSKGLVSSVSPKLKNPRASVRFVAHATRPVATCSSWPPWNEQTLRRSAPYCLSQQQYSKSLDGRGWVAQTCNLTYTRLPASSSTVHSLFLFLRRREEGAAFALSSPVCRSTAPKCMDRRARRRARTTILERGLMGSRLQLLC